MKKDPRIFLALPMDHPRPNYAATEEHLYNFLAGSRKRIDIEKYKDDARFFHGCSISINTILKKEEGKLIVLAGLYLPHYSTPDRGYRVSFPVERCLISPVKKDPRGYVIDSQKEIYGEEYVVRPFYPEERAFVHMMKEKLRREIAELLRDIEDDDL